MREDGSARRQSWGRVSAVQGPKKGRITKTQYAIRERTPRVCNASRHPFNEIVNIWSRRQPSSFRAGSPHRNA
eukprot:281817-Chlamydomonas_euryale.AAC.1